MQTVIFLTVITAIAASLLSGVHYPMDDVSYRGSALGLTNNKRTAAAHHIAKPAPAVSTAHRRAKTRNGF